MKFSSKPIEEHVEVPLADGGRWEDLVLRFERRAMPGKARGPAGNACYVVAVGLRTEAARPEAKLAEILGLVRAQGDRVVGSEVHRLAKPNARTFLGRGVCAEIAERALDLGADLLVLDAELSPSQMRNLEDAAGLPVCDREAVILNVFLRHARTRRARIQVEVAQLEYLRPRIRGLGLDMDQQAAGVMNARGPGETGSELMARRLDGRLVDLRRALAKLRKTVAAQRRGRAGCKRIALVGYTNAGKTTLMNALTAAGLSARDRPFETLDTTSRCLTRHGGDVLISDTVGFIRRLPDRLMASFESTLAEIEEASLLVLVVDASDPEWALHLETTEAMLVKLGAQKVPRYYVFNKTDLLPVAPPADGLRARAQGHPWMALSSRDAEATERLELALIREARRKERATKVFVPYGAAEVTAMVYARCRVLEAEPKSTGMLFTLEAETHIVAQVRRASEEAQP